MSKKFIDSLLAMNRKWFYVLTLGGGAVLFVVAGWFWWQNIYLKPANVFWGMIDNNLSVPGIAKRVTQTSPGATMQQDIQLNFGAGAVQSVSTLTQQAPDGKEGKVLTETIGTTEGDFVRYASIKLPAVEAKGPQDYKGIKGVWGKTPNEGKKAGQLLTESLLNTVPFANLTRDKRVALINAMKENKVYEPDLDKARHAKEDGRDVYVYPVKIYPQAYVTLLREFAGEIGLGKDLEDLDPAAYEGAPPTTVEFSVERASRQLVAVHYEGKDRQETYSSYGATPPITVPTQTIPMSELQSRIQRLQQPSTR